MHADFIGPVGPACIDGDKYDPAVLDDASAAVLEELMRVKSRVPESIKSIIKAAEKDWEAYCERWVQSCSGKHV